ncbi:hypothetical protein P2Q00_03815 [Streptomyces coacervatus]|uniref:hypothetical protein n=1 Tax=Streptomyces coacervatus TaxID=647381 RepID=UPI0023DA2C21|nr:hypothetical protein [Streptomyces coacervatus]MDF2264570.1 hypothetical protein [Streptomyces coacervatus]
MTAAEADRMNVLAPERAYGVRCAPGTSGSTASAALPACHAAHDLLRHAHPVRRSGRAPARPAAASGSVRAKPV